MESVDALQLLFKLLRCIRAITKPDNKAQGQLSPRDITTLATILDDNLLTVPTLPSTQTAERDLCEKIARCIAFMHHYRALLGSQEWAEVGSVQVERNERVLNWLHKGLLDIHDAVWDEKKCLLLCTHQQAENLLSRNYNRWIDNVDNAMAVYLQWLGAGNVNREARDNILTTFIDRDDRDTLVTMMARPTLAKIRTKVIRSLQSSLPTIHRFQSIPPAHPGTLDNILNVRLGEKTFKHWLKSTTTLPEHRLCWITGPLGSGKSILLKHLVTEFWADPLLLLNLNAEQQRPFFDINLPLPELEAINMEGYVQTKRPHILCHLFDNNSNVAIPRLSTQYMMLDLIRQLFEQDPLTMNTVCHSAMTDEQAYADLVSPNGEWTFEETENLLHMVLEDCRRRGKPVFVLLDVDEACRMEVEDFEWFNRFVERYTRDDILNQYVNVKILVAGRKEGGLEGWGWPVTIRVGGSP